MDSASVLHDITGNLLPNAWNEFAREAKKHIKVVHRFVINEAEAAIDLILLLSIFRGREQVI